MNSHCLASPTQKQKKKKMEDKLIKGLGVSLAKTPSVWTYGNTRWMTIRASLFSLMVLFLMQFFLYIFNDDSDIGLTFLFTLVLWFLTIFDYCVIIIGLYFKLPSIYDSLHIKEELRHHFVTVILIAILMTTIISVSITFKFEITTDWDTCWIPYSINLFCIYRVVHYSTHYVVRKCEENTDYGKNYGLWGHKTCLICDKEMDEYITNNIKQWQTIVDRSKDGYQVFMRFLSNEFSTENLLFITEYIEFQNILMRRLNRTSPDTVSLILSCVYFFLLCLLVYLVVFFWFVFFLSFVCLLLSFVSLCLFFFRQQD